LIIAFLTVINIIISTIFTC